MNKTKFWIIGRNFFTSKIEAEYFLKTEKEECFCFRNPMFLSSMHKCCSSIVEVEVATIIKDKKYGKFLGQKLIDLFEEKNISVAKTVEIENCIEEIKLEQQKII